MEITKEYKRHHGGKCSYGKATCIFHEGGREGLTVLLRMGAKPTPEYLIGLVQGLTEKLCNYNVTVVIHEMIEHPVDSCQAAFHVVGHTIAEHYVDVRRPPHRG